MRISKLAMVAMMACGVNAGTAFGDQANEIKLVSHCAAASCDCGEPVCGCEPVLPSCDVGCDIGCESDCCDSGCDSACGCGLGGCLTGDCCLGDPWQLFGNRNGISVGGWLQMGYHTKALPLFNSRPDEVQLHQAWLYAEKAIDTSCGFDIGGRVDYVYGTDGPDTQAFGINDNHWDNGWDHGADYGQAIPQLYVEAGYGDISVKAGHFYTIIGWEVVTAPDNFFYSHAYTMYNSEPFTHTGALATYSASDRLDIFGGYVLGWDSGFEDNGDAFLGGASLGVTDDVTLTYATVGGVFANNNFGGDERGYMHSIVADVAVSDNFQYIFQSDLLSSEDSAGTTVRDTFGINQYFIYNVNDCLSFGARAEWWNVGADSTGFQGDNANAGAIAALVAGGYDPTSQDIDVYALTMGINYRPHANVIVRPEVRFDWVDGNRAFLAAADNAILENNDANQTTFGVDTIFTY